MADNDGSNLALPSKDKMIMTCAIIGLGIICGLVIVVTLAIVGYLTGNNYGGGTSGPGGYSNLAYPRGADPAEIGACLDSYIQSIIPSSPMIGQGINFARAGQQYNVNPALMAAIGQQESAFGTAGIVKDHAYNYYGLTKSGGGWAEFSSWEEAINNHARYLREGYLDKGLTTIPQIGSKYAPVGASNDPNNLNNNWAKGVQSHFDAIVNKCPDLQPEVILAGACGVGYQGSPAICGWIQMPNKPEDYQKYNSPGEDWGKPNLVNMVMAVARSWKTTGMSTIQVGDLSAECRQAGGHASHDRGTDVDIDLPGGMMVDGTNYHPELAIDLAKKFIECGATDIGYEDPQVIQAVNSWAEQNGYSGRIRSWSGHQNHFHVRNERR